MSVTLSKLGQLTGIFNNPTNIKIVGDYAYITDSANDRLYICNISDYNNIGVVSSVHDSIYLNFVVDLYISGNYCYVIAGHSSADNYLVSIDISNVSSPTIIDYVYLGYGSKYRNIVGYGNYVYINGESSSTIKVVDISDSTNMSITDTVSINSPVCMDISDDGSYLYVGYESGGVSYLNVYSIINGSSLSYISSLSIVSGTTHLIYCKYDNNYLYITDTADNCIYSVNVSDPSSLTLADTLTDATNLQAAYNLYISGTLMYVTCVGSGDRLTVISILDPTSLTYVTNINGAGNYLDNPYGVYIIDSKAYVVSIALSFALVVFSIDIDPPSSVNLATMYRNKIIAGWDFADYADSYVIYYSTNSTVTKLNSTRVLASNNLYEFEPATKDLVYIAVCSVNGEIEGSVLSSSLLVSYAEKYRNSLLSLLPTGLAWTKRITSNLAKLLHGFATEFNRISDRVLDFLDEINLNTTTELLSEHEREYNIPDDIVSVASTTSERRTNLLARQLAYGQCHVGHFEDIATELGFTIIFVYHRPAWCGTFRCGDRLGGQDIIFYTSVAIYYNHVDYSGDESLSNLYLMFERYKQAHNTLNWAWYGPGFSSGFSSGFDSFPAGSIGSPFNSGFSTGFEVQALEENDYLWSGGFSNAFNIGFKVNRTVDLSSYFQGGFDKGFSNGFELLHYAFS